MKPYSGEVIPAASGLQKLPPASPRIGLQSGAQRAGLVSYGLQVAPQVGSAPQTSGSAIVDQAAKQYPILQKLKITGVDSYGKKPYMLETWLPNEPGSEDAPRPSSIPHDTLGIQVFDNKTRPIDVLADVSSHYLIHNDPKLGALYENFVNSVTPQQQQRFKADYDYATSKEGEKRPYADWLKATRLPAYFRGYTFQQWPDDFNRKVFTKEQMQNFDKARAYLGVESAQGSPRQ